ncbi:hypothetical protein [Citricoccus nitrophenolicus]|uniref:hypothetical protein n=1 Tax=Citricoccus nitrophenolicus TaxID=863575 RepID=UPI0031EEDD94
MTAADLINPTDNSDSDWINEPFETLTSEDFELPPIGLPEPDDAECIVGSDNDDDQRR